MDQGVTTGGSVAHSTLSKVKSKGGSEVRINVRTGLIHIIVVRKKGDISVDHLYQWALKMVERCMYLVNARGKKKHHDTTEIMIGMITRAFFYFSRVYPNGYIG